MDSISNNVKAIFSKYQIPVFIDEKSEITDNAIIKYILSILEIYSSNWNSEAVFNYIKSGLCDLEKDEIYIIEKYAQKYGINRNKWYKSAWKENEELRKKTVEPLLKLKTQLESQKNAKNISENLYKFLINNSIKEKIKIKIEK